MNFHISPQTRFFLCITMLAFTALYLSCSEKMDLNPDEATPHLWERTMERRDFTQDGVGNAPELDLTGFHNVVVKKDTVLFTNKQVLEEKQLVNKKSKGMLKVSFRRLQ